jgi:hypothetical protein
VPLDLEPKPGPRLRDPARQAEVMAQGYTLTPLLSPEALARVREIAGEATDGAGLAVSTLDRPFVENQAVSMLLTQAIAPSVAEVFADHVITGCSFVIKGSVDDGFVHLHQDWGLVDEERASSINVWCPLVDVDDTSSPLEVLPTSHRWFRTFRSPAMLPLEVEFADSLEDALVAVAPSAGQALAYDPRLFHGSRPNRSGRPRPVLVFGVVPIDVPTMICVSLPPGEVALHEVDPTLFLRAHEREIIGAATSAAPERIVPGAPPIGLTELVGRAAPGAPPIAEESPWWRRRLSNARGLGRASKGQAGAST